MSVVFEKTYSLTTNQFDKNDVMKCSALLDIAQDIAARHADKLHIGFSDLMKENLIWVVVRNKLTIKKPIKNIDEIKVRTEPFKARFVEYYRETKFFVGDEEVANLISVWMMVDIKSFSLGNSEIYKNIKDLQAFSGERVKKLPTVSNENLLFNQDRKVTYTMLDHNGHMNNTHYLDLFDDIFRPEKIVKEVQIEYLKQSFIDDVLSLYTYKNEDGNFLYGYKENELRFYLKVNFIDEGEQDEN